MGITLAALGMASSTHAKGLMVHEWGTFTTLSACDGRSLAGLYVDASRLPAFVHGIPYFNYDTAFGWAPLSKLRHVTVKMETPVLYFYAPDSLDVDVKVKFQGGTISQWYPQAYDREADPAGPYVDFAAGPNPYSGHIGWKAKVLAPEMKPAYTTTGSGQETPEWTAPRNVASNMLRGEGGEYERFLFYRGLGNFPSTVKLKFRDDSTLAILNDGEDDLPWLMVYDRRNGGDAMPAGILWQGALAAHAMICVPVPKLDAVDYGVGMAAMDTLQNRLIQAGLFPDEAKALVQTWYDGYFHEGGLKAFWILPRALVDRILPLTITPAPEALQRVIVGRSEILWPAFESELRAARDADTLAHFSADKFRMAYQDFLFPDPDAESLALRPRPPFADAADPVRRESRPGFGWKVLGIRDALGRWAP